MSHTKCTQHQKYDCPVCVEFEGPVARGRRLEAEVERLRNAIGPALSMLESNHITPKTPHADCPVCELRRVYDGVKP